jgi:hypothetical protein
MKELKAKYVLKAAVEGKAVERSKVEMTGMVLCPAVMMAQVKVAKGSRWVAGRESRWAREESLCLPPNPLATSADSAASCFVWQAVKLVMIA